jgi:hypothetical protein
VTDEDGSIQLCNFMDFAKSINHDLAIYGYPVNYANSTPNPKPEILNSGRGNGRGWEYPAPLGARMFLDRAIRGGRNPGESEREGEGEREGERGRERASEGERGREGVQDFGVLNDATSCFNCVACYRFRVVAAAGYMGTSLIRNRAPLGPYSKTMSRLLWRFQEGGGAISYERGTRLHIPHCCGRGLFSCGVKFRWKPTGSTSGLECFSVAPFEV